MTDVGTGHIKKSHAEKLFLHWNDGPVVRRKENAICLLSSALHLFSTRWTQRVRKTFCSVWLSSFLQNGSRSSVDADEHSIADRTFFASTFLIVCQIRACSTSLPVRQITTFYTNISLKKKIERLVISFISLSRYQWLVDRGVASSFAYRSIIKPERFDMHTEEIRWWFSRRRVKLQKPETERKHFLVWLWNIQKKKKNVHSWSWRLEKEFRFHIVRGKPHPFYGVDDSYRFRRSKPQRCRVSVAF